MAAEEDPAAVAAVPGQERAQLFVTRVRVLAASGARLKGVRPSRAPVVAAAEREADAGRLPVAAAAPEATAHQVVRREAAGVEAAATRGATREPAPPRTRALVVQPVGRLVRHDRPTPARPTHRVSPPAARPLVRHRAPAERAAVRRRAADLFAGESIVATPRVPATRRAAAAADAAEADAGAVAASPDKRVCH